MSEAYLSGHTEAEIPEGFQKEMGRKIKNFGDDCVMLNPGGVLYPRKLLSLMNDLYNFESRRDDVFIACYSKTGSTWTQEIIWSMFHNPNLDHENADWGTYKKSPCFEVDIFTTTDNPFAEVLGKDLEEEDKKNFLGLYKGVPNPRIFKTHLHFKFFSPETMKKSRFIYVIRNPLAVCVSYYHFNKKMDYLAYPGSLDEFVDDFIYGKTLSGSYLNHLKQWWKVKDNKNVYTLFYEKMKKDTYGELRKLSDFLGAGVTTEQLKNVEEFTSFAEMKARDDAKLKDGKKDEYIFCRKGEVDSYKKDLSRTSINKINKHFRENLGEVELDYDFSPVTDSNFSELFIRYLS